MTSDADSGSDLVEVVIETPRGSRNKYEYDPDSGQVRFDRRLPGSFAFPADYGVVPDAVGSDGERLDALVLLVEPAYPAVRVRARPVGVLWIRTGSGRREAKLVLVPEDEPAYSEVHDLDELPAHQLTELRNFFDIYRSLDAHSSTAYDGSDGAQVARQVVAEARAAAQRS